MKQFFQSMFVKVGAFFKTVGTKVAVAFAGLTKTQLIAVITTASVVVAGGATALTVCLTVHDWSDPVVTVAPTCETAGEQRYDCTICDKDKTEEIPALGHDWAEVWSFDGEKHYHVCNREGCSAHSDEAFHTTADGKHVCEICGYTLSVCLDENKDHNCDICGTKLSDCSDENRDHNCDLCGNKLSEHTGGTATCTGGAICSLCGNEYGTPLGHDYGNWVSNNNGTHTKVCARDNSHTETVNCSGGQATCTESATCEYCNAKYGSALGHDIDLENWTSCKDGHYHACKHSGCDLKQGLTAHTFVDGVCSVCDGKDLNGTEGLEYFFGSNGGYAVTGYDGTATDVVIPYYYDDGEHGVKPVVEFYQSAFNGNTRITSVVIPGTITKINANAFGDCTSLTDITVPDSVYIIKGNAFIGTPYWDNKDGVVYVGKVLYGYKGEMPENYALEIQSGTISIADTAFANRSNLVSVSMPDSLKRIGYYSFARSGIKAINIGANVTYIDSGAFNGCTSVETITLGAKVETIKDNAFYGCEKVTSLVIPASVKTIGEWAFGNTFALKNVTVDGSGLTTLGGGLFEPGGMFDPDSAIEQITFNLTLDELKAITDADNLWFTGRMPNLVINYNGGSFRVHHAKVEATCTADGTEEYWYNFLDGKNYANAWFNEPAEDITISALGHDYGNWISEVPAKCAETGIKGHYTCWRCNHNFDIDKNELTDLTIGVLGHNMVPHAKKDPTCTEVGWDEYEECDREGCAESTKVEKPALDHDWDTSKWCHDDDGHWHECRRENCNARSDEAVHSNTDNSHTCSICTHELSKCNDGDNDHYCDLCNAKLTECVDLDKDHACDICKTTMGVHTPANDKTHTCSYCNKRASDCVDNDKNHNCDVCGEVLSTCADDDNDHMCDVCGNKLSDCQYDAQGVCKCGACDTSGSVNLQYTKVEDSGQTYYSVKGFGTNAVDEDVVIARWQYDEADGAYYPVKAIGGSAFINKTSIKSVTIPNGIETILSDAFYNCTAITSITIPDSVTSIGARAFQGCSALSEIKIGSGVNFIDDNAFTDSGLTRVEIASLESWCGVRFGTSTNLNNTPTQNPLYKAHHLYIKGIENEITELVIPDSVSSIAECAFYGCTSLTKVTIPDSVTSIGYAAFGKCGGITEMTVPFVGDAVADPSDEDVYKHIGWFFGQYSYTGGEESTTSYDSKTYYLPTALKSVTVTKYLANGAFYKCKQIESVTLGSNISNISKYAFHSCEKLNNITLSDNITSIGQFAFANTAITQMVIPSKVTVIERNTFSGCGELTEVTIGQNIEIIDQGAFLNCEKLVSITLPSKVTSIEKSTFSGCSSLTSVTFLGNITSIGDYAFYDASKLPSIVIPSTVKTIDYCAFKNCSALTSVTIGSDSQLESIGNDVFYNCSKLENITLPEGIETIEQFTFYNCSALTSINIPASVKKIGTSAFTDCTSLTSVHITDLSAWCGIVIAYYSNNPLYYAKNLYLNGTLVTALEIPEGITSIKDFAFINAECLESVVIPEGVTSIGEKAFYNCSNLVSVTMPDSVESIGEDAFTGTAWVNNDSTEGLVYAGKIAFKYNGTMPENTTITLKEGTVGIADNLFKDQTNLVGIVIPNSVTNIGDRAFYGCTGLTSVTIPNSVTNIGILTFKDCTGLTSVTISNSVTSIGDRVFYGCKSLANVTIPDSVTSIESNAFCGCSKLERITLGSGLEEIGGYAFYNCYALKQVHVPSLEYWCNITFGNAASPLANESAKLYVNGSILSGTVEVKNVTDIPDYTFRNNTSITSVIIDEGVKSIGYQAFYECINLTSVTIPESVTTIYSKAFYKCYKLIEIYNKSSLTLTAGNSSNGYVAYYAKNIYDTAGQSKLSTDENGYIIYTDGDDKILVVYTGTEAELTLPDGITEIYKYAFYNRTDIKSVVISDSVKSIGDYAFQGCKNMASLTVGAGLTSIGQEVFTGCDSLTTVNWNATAFGTSLSESPFKGCYSLTTVIIGDNVTEVPAKLFLRVSSITNVTVGSSVTSIGNNAFNYCYKLIEVYNKSSLTLTAGSTENGYVACYAKNIYDTEGQSKLSTDKDGYTTCLVDGDKILVGYVGTQTELTLPGDIKEIKDYAFSNNANITKVIIPDSVGTIGESAFYNCTGLREVTIGANVKTIGQLAFGYCSALTSITIPDSVTSIGASAFSGCKNLKEVTISKNVSTIGNNAFKNCTSLTEVTIPDKVNTINEYTFYDCTSLKSVTIGAEVTEIKEGAFLNCNKLAIVEGGSKVTTIGSKAFSHCYGLTSFAMPSVTSIGEQAFYNCWGLISVTIPNGTTTIGNKAFEGCYKLIEICNKSSLMLTIGNTDNGYVACYAKNIYTDAEGQSKLSTDKDGFVTYSDGADKLLVGFTGTATEIVIPEGITEIYKYAFYSSSITSVTIDGNVKAICEYAFRACRSLVSVTMGESVESIGNDAFNGCSALPNITIGASVTSIGSYAFHNCTALSQVTISASVTSIGKYAFQYCQSLNSVIFEDTDTWYYTSNETYWNEKKNGQYRDVTSAYRNATDLKSTYVDCYWYKV